MLLLGLPSLHAIAIQHMRERSDKAILMATVFDYMTSDEKIVSEHVKQT